MNKFLFTVLAAMLMNGAVHAQEWELHMHNLKFSNIATARDVKKLSYSVTEGSRTDHHSLSFNTGSKSFAFSYITMGGNLPSLIIKKGRSVMLIYFGRDLPGKSITAQQIKVKFRSGLYVLQDFKLVRKGSIPGELAEKIRSAAPLTPTVR